MKVIWSFLPSQSIRHHMYLEKTENSIGKVHLLTYVQISDEVVCIYIPFTCNIFCILYTNIYFYKLAGHKHFCSIWFMFLGTKELRTPFFINIRKKWVISETYNFEIEMSDWNGMSNICWINIFLYTSWWIWKMYVKMKLQKNNFRNCDKRTHQNIAQKNEK